MRDLVTKVPVGVAEEELADISRSVGDHVLEVLGVLEVVRGFSLYVDVVLLILVKEGEFLRAPLIGN